MAIGVPGKNGGAGAVDILYGSPSGLSTSFKPNLHLNQDILGYESNIGELFGSALSSGDFNGDGFEDLAISAIEESVNGVTAAGTVTVVFGSVSGLSSAHASIAAQVWHQDIENISGEPEKDDNFGASLTTGYFNGDIYEDLAIGVPNEDLNGLVNSGTVLVIYGSIDGLQADTGLSTRMWHQDRDKIQDHSEPYDLFGISLVAGDFNNDFKDDLAIGVSSENNDKGAVSIIYGSDNGLSATFIPDQLWSQDSRDIENVAEFGDQFGFSIAT